MTAPVQVPADVEREDRLLGPLTARQLVVVIATAAVVYGLWRLCGPAHPAAFVAAAVPVAVLGTALTLGRRDGLSLDRLLVAALRQRAALPSAPRAARGDSTEKETRGADSGRLVSSRLPLRGVRSAGSDRLGIADLAGAGSVVVCAVSPLNLSLRSAAEQQAAVAGFARWLHSLSGPVQLLTRTRPLDLSGPITRLHAAAGRLASPALARAALGHAAHLRALDAQAELLHREFLIVFRDPAPAGRGPRAAAAAAEALRRRAGEAAALLGPLGLRVTALSDADAAAVLRRATAPATTLHPSTDHDVGQDIGQDIGPDVGHGPDPVADRSRRRVDLDPPTVELELPIPAVPWRTTGPTGPTGPTERGRLGACVGVGRRRRRRPRPDRSRRHPMKNLIDKWKRSRSRLAGSGRPDDDAAGGAGGGWFAPAAVRVAARRVGLDGVWSATLVVTGYPREVPGAGWLAPLTEHPGLVDVSVHVTPLDPVTAAARLRRLLARLEAGRRSGSDHGRLPDPEVDAAAEDAQLLADRVARGEAKLFTTTVTVTVTATTETGLDDEVAALNALLASLLITAHPTSWRAWHGWLTGLPLGIDHIGTGRILDTAALAAAFPFSSPDLPPPDTAGADHATTGEHDGNGGNGGGGGGSVLYGYNLSSSSLVFWDRWRCDNYNSVTLGRSGAGKSYLTKLELLRSLYTGVHAQVVDPEDEYVRLAEAVGATVIRLGAPGARINPLALDVHAHPDGARTAAPDALARRRLALHSFLALALNTGPAGSGGSQGRGGEEVSASERAVLDEAITTTYTRAGISDDPATWTRPAPLLADLHAALLDPATDPTVTRDETAQGSIARALTPDAGMDPDAEEPGATAQSPADSSPVESTSAVAADVARRLRPFVDGAFSALFNGPTSHPPSGAALTVWSLRELPEPLRPLGTMLVLDAIWRTVTHPHDRRRRMIVVDEAWLLLQHQAGAQFLLRAAKAGRKHWCGLVLATQDTADVLSSDLGRAVITNSATQILLRQAPQAIDRVVEVFGLSAGERSLLLSAERGDGLLTAGEQRCAFAALAAAEEDELITTDPAQLANQTAASPEWITLDPPGPATADRIRPGQADPGRRGPSPTRSDSAGSGSGRAGSERTGTGWVW